MYIICFILLRRPGRKMACELLDTRVSPLHQAPIRKVNLLLEVEFYTNILKFNHCCILYHTLIIIIEYSFLSEI